MNTEAFPFSRPLYVMAKPAGAACNMACHYCYYIEKGKYYAHEATANIMGDALLETFIRQYIETQTTHEVLFTWHGGEPLLRPLSFYQRAMKLQERHARGHHIDNCLQTNGTLLTDEWCRFLADNRWLVGLSIDGPQDMHDAYRRMRGGAPTFDKVMRAVELLDKHGVEWNAMAVVNDINSREPLRFYRFFKNIGCHYLQFSPIVERWTADGQRSLASPAVPPAGGKMTPWSVQPDAWGDFLCTLFDEWRTKDVGKTFVQLFDATLANWVGEPPGVCTLSPICGRALALEHNGDVFPCDHFVFPEYLLGNIRHQSLTELALSGRLNAFGEAKRTTLPEQCAECRWLFACNGECPKNRIALTADGVSGLNYLCEGYRRFFSHAAPYMDFMSRELAEGRAPANVMSQHNIGSEE